MCPESVINFTATWCGCIILFHIELIYSILNVLTFTSKQSVLFFTSLKHLWHFYYLLQNHVDVSYFVDYFAERRLTNKFNSRRFVSWFSFHLFWKFTHLANYIVEKKTCNKNEISGNMNISNKVLGFLGWVGDGQESWN